MDDGGECEERHKGWKYSCESDKCYNRVRVKELSNEKLEAHLEPLYSEFLALVMTFPGTSTVSIVSSCLRFCYVVDGWLELQLTV